MYWSINYVKRTGMLLILYQCVLYSVWVGVFGCILCLCIQNGWIGLGHNQQKNTGELRAISLPISSKIAPLK